MRIEPGDRQPIRTHFIDDRCSTQDLKLSAPANLAGPLPFERLDVAKHVDSRRVGAPRLTGTLASNALSQEQRLGTKLDEPIYRNRNAAQRLSSAAAS
jgi:hypothetical protein